MVITPVNYYLASVNFFVGCTGLVQLLRVLNYRRTHPGGEVAPLTAAVPPVENPKGVVSAEAGGGKEEVK